MGRREGGVSARPETPEGPHISLVEEEEEDLLLWFVLSRWLLPLLLPSNSSHRVPVLWAPGA